MSNILKKADQIVNERSEEKERQYGPFIESMKRATTIYNSMSPVNEQISVGGMYRAMIALKLSREAYKHKEDNLLDAVAYMGSMNDYLENIPPRKKIKMPYARCINFPAECGTCMYFKGDNLECSYQDKQ